MQTFLSTIVFIAYQTRQRSNSPLNSHTIPTRERGEKKRYCEEIAHCLTFTSSVYNTSAKCLRCSTCSSACLPLRQLFRASWMCQSCFWLCGTDTDNCLHGCACVDLHLIYSGPNASLETQVLDVSIFVFDRNCWYTPSHKEETKEPTKKKKTFLKGRGSGSSEMEGNKGHVLYVHAQKAIQKCMALAIEANWFVRAGGC